MTGLLLRNRTRATNNDLDDLITPFVKAVRGAANMPSGAEEAVVTTFKALGAPSGSITFSGVGTAALLVINASTFQEGEEWSAGISASASATALAAAIESAFPTMDVTVDGTTITLTAQTGSGNSITEVLDPSNHVAVSQFTSPKLISQTAYILDEGSEGEVWTRTSRNSGADWSEWTLLAAGEGGGSQVQADWAEDDTEAPSYIDNKPTLGTMAAQTESNYYTTTEADGLLDDKLDLAGGNITGPVTTGAISGGTVTTGTVFLNGDLRHYINGGAHALDPPVASCSGAVRITNNGSAGAIDLGDWDSVTGDDLTTVNGDIFLCTFVSIDGTHVLNISAVP